MTTSSQHPSSPNENGSLPPVDEPRTRELQAFLGRFGLEESSPALLNDLNQAFLHRSFRTEAGLAEDNERLAFLGDSVVGLATTEYLLETHPQADEGWMSKLRAAMVSRAILGEIGRRLGIGELLLLSTGEERSGGRQRISILGSALEAVCGVLYQHCRWEDLRAPLRQTVVLPAAGLAEKKHLVDYKSRLQEVTQRHYGAVPEYVVVGEGGPDHSKTFAVEAHLEGRVLGLGAGARKKTAENDAAREALRVLRAEHPEFFL